MLFGVVITGQSRIESDSCITNTGIVPLLYTPTIARRSPHLTKKRLVVELVERLDELLRRPLPIAVLLRGEKHQEDA
jgi:hypothetical protein